MRETLLTSSVLILALLGLRAAFRRTISRRVQYALWGLVLARLLIPASLPSVNFSVLTAAEPVGQSVSEQLSGRRIYVPVARAPLTEHPTAPDLDPSRAMPPGGSSVWVAETEETAVRYRSLTAGEALVLVWLAGAGGMLAFFLVTNLGFWRRLRKGRTPYTVHGCKYPVYLVEAGLPSPCLFGLLRPAVYLTPAAAETEETLRHVIAHESTHARHGDPLWSLLRCVCLAVYWFDPLVWAAALASKADCELACDEGALKRLGEAERIPYGKTLLSLIPVRKAPSNPLLSATTMTAGKRQLKDRITRIAENRQTRAAALFAAAVLAVGVCAVTFTGAKREEARPLTGDELAYFNEEFFNGEGFNLRNQFLSSLYETPEDIDLFALFYCGTEAEETVTAAERQAAAEAGYDGNDPGVDLTKISAGSLDALLLQYTGLTAAQTNQVDLDAFTYLPEYDAYYFFHGDTNYRANILFTAGEREGDTVRLYCTDGYFGGPSVTTCVTLAAQPNGSYWFVSHLLSELPAVPTVYPEGEAALSIALDGLSPHEAEPATVTRRRDDCAERYGGFMADEDTTFRVYRSTDGNLYAAVEYEAAVANGEMTLWDAGCFFTFPADTDPERIDGDFFQNLFGRSGVVISYGGRIGEHEYGTLSDYYYMEDGVPVLLARACGTPVILDLDGDGENELCAAAGSTAQVFFQRDGEIYQADAAALLADAWPEAEYLSFGGWDVSRRSLPLSGEVPVPDAGRSGTAFRRLYFDGKALRLYRDGTVYADHIAAGIDAPEAVLAAARDFVLARCEAGEDGFALVDGAFQAAPPRVSYDDWRITELEGPFRETAGGLTLDVWRLGYELHTSTPGQVVLAGGRYMTEDGWVSQGYPGCDYLYFTVNTSSGPSLLFSAMVNDCAPGTEMFFSDMVDRLLEMGLLAPSDLDGRALLAMLSSQPVSFLNRLAGEWPQEEAYAALATLGRYLAYDSGYDEQTAYADSARYVDRFGEDLTAEGRVAWNWLQALAAGAGSSGPDPAADFRGFTPPEVLSAALEAAEADYAAFRAQGGDQYDGWRLSRLSLVGGYAPFDGLPLEIYSMGAHAHAAAQESAGADHLLAGDGGFWLGFVSAPYLVFLQENGHYRLLSRDINFDTFPSSPSFRAELAAILLDQGLVTPEAIGARTLLSMFYGGNVNFLNRMGALPRDQQADAVEALASFHRQGLFAEEGELRDAIQSSVWGQRSLDAKGAALLRALLDRTDIQAFGAGETFDDLDAAIRQTLLDRRQSASAHKDDFYAAAYHVLDTVGTGCTDTVYLLTCFGSYDTGPEGGYTLQTGGTIPAALTFARVNDLYQLTEYWEPGGGADYAPDLRACFPETASDAALDPDSAVLEALQARVEQDAAQHFAQT